MKRYKTRITKLFALLLTLIMVIGCFPMSVLADTEGGSDSATSSKRASKIPSDWDSSTGYYRWHNTYALRLSVYFYPGVNSMDEITKDIIPDCLGVTNIWYSGDLAIFKGWHTDNTVHDYLGYQEHGINDNLEHFSYEYYDDNIEFGELPFGYIQLSDGRNLADAWPEMFTFTGVNNPHSGNNYSMNKFLQGVDSLSEIPGAKQGDKYSWTEINAYYQEHPEKLQNVIDIINGVLNSSVDGDKAGNTVDMDGLLQGYYISSDGVHHNGIIELYMEPIASYVFNNTTYVGTYKDFLAFLKGRGSETFKTKFVEKITDISGKIYLGQQTSRTKNAKGEWINWDWTANSDPSLYNSYGRAKRTGLSKDLSVSYTNEKGEPKKARVNVTNISINGLEFGDVKDVTTDRGVIALRNAYAKYSGGYAEVPYESESNSTIAGSSASSLRDIGRAIYLTEFDHRGIRMSGTKDTAAVNGNFDLQGNLSVASLGVGVFTSFNGVAPAELSTPVKLVKSYVVKDGTGFKEYKPSESTVITDSDVHTILRNEVVEKTNLVEIQNAVDFMNGDVSCVGALNDIITTAEYYDNLSNVKWEGDEPTVNGKSLSSDLISGRASNLITGTKNITKNDVLKASNDENVTVKSNIADDAKVASLIDSSVNAGKSLSGKSVTFMNDAITTGEQKYNLFDNAKDAGSSAVVSANHANTSSKMLLTAGIMADLMGKDGKEVHKLSAVYMEANPKGTAGEIAEKRALSQALWNQYKAEFYNGKNGPLPENTIFLRYVVVPTINQYNVIEIEDKTTGKVTYTDGGTFKISIADDGSYKIHEPDADISMIEAVEWAGSKEVNNPEGDFSKKGVMPGDAPKQGVMEYTAGDNLVITNYPDSENLYVKWYVYKDSLVTGDTSVPQWRWSKYADSVAGIVGDKAVSEMKFELTADTTTHKPTYLSPSGTYNYDIINPNGSLNTGSNVSMTSINNGNSCLLNEYRTVAANNFFRSKGYTGENSSKSNFTTETVTHGDTHAMYGIDGTLNMVKSTKATDGSDNNMLITANWLSNNDLTTYGISTGKLPLSYSGGKQFVRLADLKYSLYNKYDYTHYIAVRKTGDCNCGKDDHCPGHILGHRCACYLDQETFYKTDQGMYKTANYDINVVFNRYIAGDTKNKFTLAKPIVDSKNCKTTVKYQLTDTLNIYPEVGMMFQDDSARNTIKWAVGEKVRTINPIVWQTLEHKVYVNETVVGTSVATDSRATAKARSIGFGSLQTIYKGSATNTAFQIYRNSNMNQKGILTAKTFALDIDSVVKNDWGNSAYNSEKQHTALVNGIKNNNVKATEKLLIDSQNFGDLDYTGDAKEQNTIKYQPIKYNNGEVTTFTHKLIVRGGYLVGVKYQDRNSLAYSNVKISDLKAKDEALYEAIVNMGLYNEANDKANTLFVAFENKTGDKLTEKTYADDLAKARKALDGIDTTGEAKIVENAGWYSEDSTVLVIKEYVTNFEVPSTSFTDKISLTVKNLDTPINKNDFFTKVGKGYTFLRYDLTIPQDAVYNSVEKIGAYFEANGFDGTNNVNTPKYLVPNVTITDTTR